MYSKDADGDDSIDAVPDRRCISARQACALGGRHDQTQIPFPISSPASSSLWRPSCFRPLLQNDLQRR